MTTKFNSIQVKIRNNGAKDISSEDLLFYLGHATKNNNLKTINKQRIENYFYDINRSYFFENIFTNKGNYSQLALYFIGLLIPLYMNYPKMYNLGFIGFFIGILSFISLYQFVNTLYGNFFPSASRLFIFLSIAFYIVFFLFFNKLNHISLFFISCIVSFCIINYIYRLILTVPTKSNIYNKLNVTFEDKKDYMDYDYILEDVCKEVINRFGMKLPSGKMLYSYLTVFKIGENKNKVSDFLVNLFSPFITLIYNYYLGSFLDSIMNKDYNGKELKVIPIIGLNHESKTYLTCQANYVLPIEFNFNSFIHEFYQERELDDDQYRIFLKCIKRINYELLDKYKPKFVKLEDLQPEELAEHLKNNVKDKNHILVQLENFFKDKDIELKFDNKDYLRSLKDFIKNADIKDVDRDAAIQLFHKINQTLEIKTNHNRSNMNKEKNTMKKNEKTKGYPDDFGENIDLAIQVLLDNEDIKKESKVLLKKLSQNYVDYFRKNIRENRLYGYNYNLWTYPYFDREYREGSNTIFLMLIRLISTFVLFARPITSGWLLSIFALIPVIEYKNYFKYFNEDSWIMKYLGMGIDDEYFIDNYNDDINNNNITNKGFKILYKFLLFIFIALPFLQFYNNTFYGLTFSPNYMNIFYQFIFILNLIGNIYADSLGLERMSFNIIFWVIFFIILLILYFVFKNK